MTNNTVFTETATRLFPQLKQFVPVVDKVHGPHHPEFHEVRTLFGTVVDKTEAASPGKPDLTEEFTKLEEITDNYTVPGDVCESYEAVFNWLAELDHAYQA